MRSSVVAQLFNANDNNAVNGLLWWQWNAVVGGVFNIKISTSSTNSYTNTILSAAKEQVVVAVFAWQLLGLR